MKINMLRIKKFAKLEITVITREYRGAAHGISNLKFSIPEIIHIVFITDLTVIIIYHKGVSRRI